jgi:DeoR family transcriptional regulator, aga operon transcriptional repressor
MDEQFSLLAAERRNRIAEMVARQGVVRVGELSETFRVSEVTIRSDLDLLARQGLVVRDRGGAVANLRAGLAVAFEQRAALNQEEKRRIGRAAAQLVQPGDTIIMDAGSTMLEMARCLGNVAPLTVVTNALNVATELGSFPDVHVILVGGSLDRATISAVGPHAIRDFCEYVVPKVFLGVHALDPVAGLTDCSIEIAEMKRTLIGVARQVTLLADAGKWGRVGLVKVAPLSAVQTIVSDAGLPAEAQAAVRELGIGLLLA